MKIVLSLLGMLVAGVLCAAEPHAAVATASVSPALIRTIYPVRHGNYYASQHGYEG